jgi:hypothetical protein
LKDPDWKEIERLVQIADLCATLHCLPEEGGLYDQDYLLVEGIHLVLLARQAKSEQEHAKLKDEMEARQRATRH